jgi:hypothetical protein
MTWFGWKKLHALGRQTALSKSRILVLDSSEPLSDEVNSPLKVIWAIHLRVP